MISFPALFGALSQLFTASQSDIQDRHQRYLSEAVDMCDLEQRIRELDGARQRFAVGNVRGVFGG